MTTVITGFPSNHLATAVLSALVDDSSTDRIICIVPPSEIERARVLLLGGTERVELVEGDCTSMDLGLSGAEIMSLSKSVRVIHHCAAVTHSSAEPRHAKLVNVGGTREALELATTAQRLERFVHWSTAFVSGTRRGVALEDELVDPPGFHDAIEETRFRAERLVDAARSRVPVTVLRPTMIVGDSRTGAFGRIDGPYTVISWMMSAPGELQVPLVGRGDRPLPIVPVDYVVRAGLAIVASPQSVGLRFHLVDPEPMSARAAFELFARELGKPAPRVYVPTRLVSALLRAPGLERLAPGQSAFFSRIGTDIVFDDRQTRAILRDTRIQCPPVSSYAASMVEWVKQEAKRRRDRGRVEVEDSLA